MTDLKALSDNELAERVKQQDAAAFEELIRRYQGRVYAIAYRVSGNREDALDIAQEAFVKAYRKIDAWQPTGGFAPWLLRLTTNQSIDFIRKRKRHAQESLDEQYLPETAGAAVQPSSQDTARAVHAIEIEERIRKALVVLSPSQRAVFMLRHYEGLQLADIAAEMGCTVGSVKVHLFRALKKLQVELKDLY
ncbi:MAG: sigma-70 family RNA polymerase sigma factor [Candidatus Hydrogenedentes bacterium]|nr:sigma-70 family RNA polymerase sigma factor [Candidatus Hydrogenedentota bacterium]